MHVSLFATSSENWSARIIIVIVTEMKYVAKEQFYKDVNGTGVRNEERVVKHDNYKRR